MKKYRKSKKASHVGFAISFVLFIGFIIFMFGMISPLMKLKTGKENLVKNIEMAILENSSSELMIVSAVEDSSSGCTKIDNLNMQNVITKQEGNLLKIYSSKEFPSNSFQCSTGYKIGLIRKEKDVFEKNLLNLIDNYNIDYEGLKKYFNIPEENNFEFSFIYSNQTEIKTQSKDIPTTDVFAKRIPITYITNEAEKEIGGINIIVW